MKSPAEKAAQLAAAEARKHPTPEARAAYRAAMNSEAEVYGPVRSKVERAQPMNPAPALPSGEVADGSALPPLLGGSSDATKRTRGSTTTKRKRGSTTTKRKRAKTSQ